MSSHVHSMLNLNLFTHDDDDYLFDMYQILLREREERKKNPTHPRFEVECELLLAVIMRDGLARRSARARERIVMLKVLTY